MNLKNIILYIILCIFLKNIILNINNYIFYLDIYSKNRIILI